MKPPRIVLGTGLALSLVLSLGFAPSTAFAGAAAEPDGPHLENSVVKIFSTLRLPDPVHPWAKESPQEIRGSGVVIDGKRILTNAHMVVWASQVEIQGYQSGDRIPATVEAIAPGIDLAVLKLEDETFFDTHAALPRAASLPAVKDTVLVYGYPTGGTSLSITKGIVSRIEFVSYNFPVSGLRVQIDAALNPGNSGGPAVSGDKMIGLAFSRQTRGRSENIGYIIPIEEIEYFFHQIAAGRPYQKPVLFDEVQTLENSALRAFLKVDKSVTGLVVTRPDRSDPAYPLKPWDVITRIGNTPIDDEGMVEVNGMPRVGFAYLVQSQARNGFVPLTIVRRNKPIAIKLPVMSDRPMLIPDRPGTYLSYFILGPVVFSAARAEFANVLARNAMATATLSAIGNPLLTRRGDRPAFNGEELVVIPSPFFPHRLAQGYSNPQARVVKSINGIAIKNLAHLVTVLRDSRDKFVVIDFFGRATETLVLPRQEAIAATDDILNDNGIRSQGSAEAMAVWNAKPHS